MCLPSYETCVIVPADRENELVATVFRINGALRDAGLLSQWRAKIGGTSTERWILLIGNKS